MGRRARAIGTGVGLLALAASGCTPQAPPSDARVLFIGNSRVYYHDQPAMLEALARANGRSVSWQMFVEGGATIASRIQDGALDTLREGRWDAVVVNEQSTWGLARFVEGETRVPEAPEGFFTSVDSVAAAARGIEADLLLVAHPRQRPMPPEDGDLLIEGFASAAARHPGTRVVPLETVWRIASERLPDVELYEGDGNHPSPVGALLSAMATYRTLFGEPPRSVPDTIRGPFVEQGDGVLHRDSIVELVTLEPGLAGALVEVVRRAHERWPADVQGAEHAKAVEVPQLDSASEGIEWAALEGTWRGELRAYPRFITWPAAMSLHIHAGTTRTATLQVSFGGTPPDIEYEMLPVSNEGVYLQFLDPDGPNGGFVRYRLVPEADTLRGIAEFSNDGSVYGIGTVRLTRVR